MMLPVTENKKQLRPYQVNSIDRVALMLKEGKKRVIFQLATGGGKTVTFAGLINRYLSKQDKKVLVLVHREELLKQARRTLFNWYDIAAAPVTAGIKYLPDVPVYVAMVETANNRIRKNPSYFKNIGLVIVDECHIGNFKKLYDHFNTSWIIGFTATPISGSKKDPLKNHFEDIVCGIDIPELISGGSLAPNKTKHIKNINREQLTVKNGEFEERQMGVVFSNTRHIQNCVAAYQKHCAGMKTLIFNVNIEHSKKVNAAFQAFGLPSRHLDGNATPYERNDTLEWFKNTPDAILNNVGVLTTGFDEPSIMSVVVNKSTMSLPLWLQMTGRGSRPHPGKDQFLILDMGGNATTHGDWCDPHDWRDIFFNPDKPREGGTAPRKVCIGCNSLIHASTKACPECGANNSNNVTYDDGTARLEDLITRRPITIDMDSMILEHSLKRTAKNEPYKEVSLLHNLKYKIIIHASRVWKLKQIDDRTATRLLGIYQEAVKQWCEKKDHEFSWWHKKSTQEWFFAELKRVFGYIPPAIKK
jgi:superfamily II DNA or RNA helicase